MPGGTNRIRLIGGRCRGRKICFPDAHGLRPTGDRVRETLFNWLQPIIEGAVCLDLFAGSGALGFEAASRGAGRVLMIEQDRRVASALRHNSNELDLSVVEVFETDALRWLDRSDERFDLVFLDPPFGKQLLPKVLDILSRKDRLNPAALVYLESDAADPFPDLPANLQVQRDKKAGQVRYALAGYEPGHQK